MTTDDLLTALTDAMACNDAAATEALLDALEARIPADTLADLLEGLLHAVPETLDEPRPRIALCA